MATKQGTIDYILDQAASAGGITARKMIGEYALYLEGRVIALVCDDELYVKPTDAGKELLGEVEQAPPYPGAKSYFHISADSWEDRELLRGLFQITAEQLPHPKKKK